MEEKRISDIKSNGLENGDTGPLLMQTFNIRVLQVKPSMKGRSFELKSRNKSKSELQNSPKNPKDFDCFGNLNNDDDRRQKRNTMVTQNDDTEVNENMYLKVPNNKCADRVPHKLVHSKSKLSKNNFDQFYQNKYIDYKLNTILSKRGSNLNFENCPSQSNVSKNEVNSRESSCKNFNVSQKSISAIQNKLLNFKPSFSAQVGLNLANLTSTKFFRKTEKKCLSKIRSNQILKCNTMLTTFAVTKQSTSNKIFSNIIHLAIIKFDPNLIDGGFDCSVVTEDIQNKKGFTLDVLNSLKSKLKIDTSFKFYYDFEGNQIQRCTFCKSGCTCMSFITDAIKKSELQPRDRFLLISSKLNVHNIFEFAMKTNYGGTFRKKCTIFIQIFFKITDVKNTNVNKNLLIRHKSFTKTRDIDRNASNSQFLKSDDQHYKTSSIFNNKNKENSKNQFSYIDKLNQTHFSNLKFFGKNNSSKKFEVTQTNELSKDVLKASRTGFFCPIVSSTIGRLHRIDVKKISDNLLNSYFKTPHGNSHDLKVLLELIRTTNSSKQLNKTVITMMKKDLQHNSNDNFAREEYFNSAIPLQTDPAVSHLFKLNEHYVKMLSTYISREGKVALSQSIAESENYQKMKDTEHEQLMAFLEEIINRISKQEETNGSLCKKKDKLKRMFNQLDIKHQPEFIKNNIR
jgi:hypothetical protein